MIVRQFDNGRKDFIGVPDGRGGRLKRYPFLNLIGFRLRKNRQGLSYGSTVIRYRDVEMFSDHAEKSLDHARIEAKKDDHGEPL